MTKQSIQSLQLSCKQANLRACMFSQFDFPITLTWNHHGDSFCGLTTLNLKWSGSGKCECFKWTFVGTFLMKVWNVCIDMWGL